MEAYARAKPRKVVIKWRKQGGERKSNFYIKIQLRDDLNFVSCVRDVAFGRCSVETFLIQLSLGAELRKQATRKKQITEIGERYVRVEAR